jgi:hypothetical protein
MRFLAGTVPGLDSLGTKRGLSKFYGLDHHFVLIMVKLDNYSSLEDEVYGCLAVWW